MAAEKWPAEYQETEARALAKTLAQETPHVILLGGQPGSGKSGLAVMARNELSQRGGAVVIDADKLREKNPAYRALSETDPQNAADLTHKEASEWARRLTTAAVQGRRNLVIDGTMRDPEGILTLAGKLREHGYTVEARVIAVNPEVSITRARLRFEEQVAARGVGRFVNQAQHDVAYQGLADSVSALESARAVDAIRVYDASQREIYANQLVRGSWQKEPAALQALTEERTRTWTHAEHRNQVAMLTDISHLARQRADLIGDAPVLTARLEKARQALQQAEQSLTYQRAHAFETLRPSEAQSRYPELDGAYKQLQGLQEKASGTLLAGEGGSAHAQARAQLSEQLHRGQIPQGPVTREESRQVLELAASHQRLVMRDGQTFGQAAQGEVVAGSSHHVLVKVSDMVALSYERGGLDRAVSVGERVRIEPGHDRHRVHEVEQGGLKESALQKDQGRER